MVTAHPPHSPFPPSIEPNGTFLGDYDYPPLEAVDSAGQTLLIVLYSVTTALSLVGNVTVIVVLVAGKRSSRGLRVFLINLAMTDVTMAVFSIPFTYTTFMLGRWLFEPAFCPVVHFMQHLSVISSVYTLTAIGLDRYYAIMSPLDPRWSKKHGGVVQIAVIWGLAGALSSPQLMVSRAEPFQWGERVYYDCHERWSEDTETHVMASRIYMALVFVITFLLPLIVLAFTYASIAIALWRRSSPGNANSERDRHQLHAKIKVVKMLALVVAMFAVCWFPLQIFNLLVHFLPQFSWNFGSSNTSAFTVAFYACHWLSMANSFVNPVIYCFMSDNFWSDLRLLVLRCGRVLSGKSRGRMASSFRSTSYVLSFRKNSAGSHGGSVQMRRICDLEDGSTRVTTEQQCTCLAQQQTTS